MNKPVSMSNMEKLARAFEALKSHQQGPSTESLPDSKKKDTTLTKKEYIQYLSVVADGICASNFKTVADFPKFLAISFELIFVACNDENSDIRLKAEECLNRIIKASIDGSLSRTQLELYKEIKKNGPSKSLRAALWRFAEVASYIRPQKCRPYIINLLPCIAKISRREEDIVQEALASFMEKVLPVLGSFLTDMEVKNLTKVLYPNLESSSAATRRSAASMLVMICCHGRKSTVYFSKLIQTLLMFVSPVPTNLTPHLCLGVLQCFRNAMPYLKGSEDLDQGLKGSIGIVKEEEKAEVTTKQLVMIYEFLLHCTQHSDHNVVTASLESLLQLLRTPPPTLRTVLLTKGSIPVRSINQGDTAADGSEGSKEADTSQVFSIDSGLDDDQVSLNTSLTTKSELSSTANLSEIGLDTPDTSTLSSFQDSLLDSDLVDSSSEQGDIITADENDEYSNVNIGTEEDFPPTDEIDVSKGLKFIQKERKSVTEEELVAEEEEEEVVDEKELGESEQTDTVEVLEGDIGCYTDDEIPLKHLLRLLCSSFLLTGQKDGLIRDRKVRVSVKTLSLSCVGSIVGMVPELLFIRLFKTSPKGNIEDQFIRDVLLYLEHSDHQLRSQTALLIAHFLHAALRRSHYQFDEWSVEISHESESEPLRLDVLVGMLKNSLQDESSITIRYTCQAIKLCISDIFLSSYDYLGADLTYDLLEVGNSTYWLVQVELLDVISLLNFRLLNFIESQQKLHSSHLIKSERIQELLFDEVVIPLLGSDDSRVRTKAAETIIKIVPKLYYADDMVHSDAVPAMAREQVRVGLGDIIQELPNYSQLPTVTMQDLSLFQEGNTADENELEGAISRIINMLLQRLNGQCDKFLMIGIIQTLCLLGYEYSAFVYPSPWSCATNVSALSKSSSSRPSKKHTNGKGSGSGMSSTGSVGSHVSLEELCQGSGCGPLPLVMGLLTSSTLMLDLSAHQDLLTTATNLLIGAAYQSMKTGPSKAQAADVNAEDHDSWQCLQNRLLVPLAQQLLTHIVRLLSVCHHVIEGKEPGPPKNPVPVLPSLPPAPSLSPIKKRSIKFGRDKNKENIGELQAQGSPGKLEQDKSDSGEEKKTPKSTLGQFHHHPHYMKLYDTLRVAFSTFKVSLDLSKPDKLQVFIKSLLNALSQLLEVTSLAEVGKYTEEILSYLKSFVPIDASHTILSVEQLLRSLFASNLVSQSEYATNSLPRTPGKAARLTSSVRPGLFHHCFMAPYTQYTQSLASLGPRLTHTGVEAETQSTGVFGWIKLKQEKKANAKEKQTSVHSYIRLFEPLVIQALKQYTVTSSVILQQQVLHLLGQLVQLRVNYCLLDSDQIFLGFILKQFEHMEEGQIRDYHLLIPHIFHFLVMLSHERYHSKAVIALPQIIQLTGGIMASGQRASTHIIPAFRPLVQDLFVVKSQNKSESSKELDIMREVVVSNLLTLIKYHQVLELLVPVLYQAHRESEEKWKRLSRQVVDLLMPLLATQEVDIDSADALSTLHHLLGTVSPIALRPVDILLKALLLVPCPLTNRKSVQRWLALILVLLCMLTTQSKEETVLSRLKELGLTVDIFVCPKDEDKDEGDDLVTRMPNKPEEIFARFLLQTIGFVACSLIDQFSQPKTIDEDDSFLSQEAARLLLYLTHMFKSGAFRKVPLAISAMLKAPQHNCWFSLEQFNSMFLKLIPTQPLIVMEWCQLLLIFGCSDKELWSGFLHTPKRPSLSKSLSQGSLDHLDHGDEPKLTTAEEIVKRGALVLFSDFVCESYGDAEPLTWLVVNHVNDLIQLSHEHPVQYLISAIHRNSAASGLFVRAVNLRFSHFSNPRLVQSALQCLEGIHLSQSGNLLSLLIKSFLSCHWLALTKLADGLACRRIEMMLGENVEGASQMSVEDAQKLLQFLDDEGLSKRHPRLLVLLQKYKSVLAGGSSQSISGSSTKNKVLDLPRETNKEWYKSVVTDVCVCQDSAVPTSKVSAQLLSHLDVEDILSIMVSQDFDCSHLPECLSLGLELSVSEASSTTEPPSKDKLSDTNVMETSTPSKKDKTFQSDLLKASIGTLLKQVQEFVHQLPYPHQILRHTSEETGGEGDDGDYMEQMREVFHSTHHATHLRWLSGALKEFLIGVEMLKLDISEMNRENVCRMVITGVEFVCWSLEQEQIVPTMQLKHTFESLSLVLSNSQLRAVFTSDDHVSFTNSLVSCIYGLVFKVFLQSISLDRRSSLPQKSSPQTDDFETHLKTCHQVADLVDLIQPVDETNSRQATIYSLPQFLQQPIRDVVTSLARLPLVNTFARTPPLAWKMGWNPSPMEQQTTFLPPCPLDILKERDVLAEFVFRINTIGWTSRQQFEETWAALLGVVGSPDAIENVEEDIEHSQSTCLAVRAITSLLINTRLRPQPGNPTNSRQLCIPRHEHLPFLSSDKGRKLAHLRGILERKVRYLFKDRFSPNSTTDFTSHSSEEIYDDLLRSNQDQDVQDGSFTIGQLSVHGIWAINNLLPPLVDEHGVESPLPSPKIPPTKTAKGNAKLDVHSCLMLLLEVYGQWLSPIATPRTPLMQLCETVKSVLVISDIFTERSQFEWMFDTLLEVNKYHYVEDEIINQYVVPGICKAAAILGMDKDVSEKVSKLLEVTLRSNHLPSRVGALYGALYLLESDVIEDVNVFIPVLVEYISRNIVQISHSISGLSQKHTLVMLAVTFYLLEYYADILAGSQFTKTVLKHLLNTASLSDDTTSLLVYKTILLGLERLLVAKALTAHESDQLRKLATDRLCLPSSPVHALPALGLLLTSSYTREELSRRSYPAGEQPEEDVDSSDPEEFVQALERQSILFDRIRKGYPTEASLVAEVLPTFLEDFFSPQDVMNKVIGEFLSNQQPHPQLMATIVYRVFAGLHRQGQSELVQDWVLLSLSNFTQRTPVAMAIWSLSVFFMCASTNQWVQNLLPLVLSRMGKLESLDRELFVLFAKDFYRSQITESSARRAFISTFQTVSASEVAYSALLNQLLMG
ncbi:Huntingtin [Holothuria leucospilota]|uniref:Huntingtin n=1 Tax=Holothuria leucospilota TaxID=206669 RepID=A0A9Q1BHM8_HOLLE|nr:Huntingtin [Holothuria leucospilota]